MICISITADTMAGLLVKLRHAGRLSHLIELRVDGVKGFDIARLPERPRSKLIFTCRPRHLAGRFTGSEKERLGLIQQAIDSGRFHYVDVEDYLLSRIRKGRVKIIASYHNFRTTPPLSLLKHRYRKLLRPLPDVIKIVTLARDIRDNLTIFRFAQSVRSQVPLISFCMGEAGLISRILYRRFGNWLTYASLDNEPTAAGQLTYEELKNLYQADRLDKRTAIYGLIGNPVRHSLSPLFFNRLFLKSRLNAVYLPFLVKGLSIFPELTKLLAVRGYSVTMPFKQKVMKYLKWISPDAAKIGAVNTIYQTRNGLVGTNTDGVGALEALKDRPTRSALILGAGGAARAIAYSLRKAGTEVLLTSRHYHKAREVARRLNCQAVQWSKISQILSRVNLLVNATPVGMVPKTEQSPVSKHLLHKRLKVFDTVYNPPRTRLLQEAREKGCRVISGLDMFQAQAVKQACLLQAGRIIPG